MIRCFVCVLGRTGVLCVYWDVQVCCVCIGTYRCVVCVLGRTGVLCVYWDVQVCCVCIGTYTAQGGTTSHHFWCYQTTSNTLKMGRSQFTKRRENFTFDAAVCQIKLHRTVN